MDRLIALVLLRWKTELRAIARARARLLGLLLVLPGLLLFSGLGAIVVYLGVRALEARSPEALLPLLSAAATAVGCMWVLSPLVAGIAFTETHDVSRLLHFPIPLPTLVASSLIANLVQPMVLGEAPIVLALALALAGEMARLPLALGGVLLSFFLMLAVAQVGGLALHGLARNRRLADVALFVGLAIGFLVSVLPIVLLVGGGGPGLRSAVRLVLHTDLFAFSPFAWGVRASVHAGRGEAIPFLVYSGAALLAIGAAMAASAVLIHRIHRGHLDLGVAAPAGKARPAAMPLPGAIGALVEKDLRIAWRDPTLRAGLVTGLISPLILLFLLAQAQTRGSASTALLFASVVGLGSFGGNAFGFERRGMALLMLFPVARWRLLVAKNLAALAFRLPALLTLVLAALAFAPWSALPAVLTIAVVTQLVTAGLDNYLSILSPVAAPAPGQNPYGPASGGRGLGTAALAFLVLIVALAVAAPFAFLGWLPLLLGAPLLWLVSLPLALAGAAAVYAMLVAGAETLLLRREPELLERILVEA